MTIDKKIIYYSENNKQPLDYTKTYNTSYRYLGYRDIPKIIKKYLQEGKALDYGSGTGYSTRFLSKLGFNVVGVDINQEMVQEARLQCPDLTFYYMEDRVIPFKDLSFDLVFSSFVLLEIGSQKEMVNYLVEAKRVMKGSSALFVAITGSEHLHDPSKNWLDFSTNFPENKNRISGSLVKLYHYNSHIEFSDHYWTQIDYQDCFAKAGFNIIDIKTPLGEKGEGYAWHDELVTSPFVIFVAISE